MGRSRAIIHDRDPFVDRAAAEETAPERENQCHSNCTKHENQTYLLQDAPFAPPFAASWGTTTGTWRVSGIRGVQNERSVPGQTDPVTANSVIILRSSASVMA